VSNMPDVRFYTRRGVEEAFSDAISEARPFNPGLPIPEKTRQEVRARGSCEDCGCDAYPRLPNSRCDQFWQGIGGGGERGCTSRRPWRGRLLEQPRPPDVPPGLVNLRLVKDE
jgi:hypothetical protein